MQQVKIINDNPIVNLIVLLILSCLGASILIVSFVLCGDIYGAGPAFVAVSGALATCGFIGFLWYARVKNLAAQYYNMNFGIALILGVAALQQAVMFGGLGTDTFQNRMMALAENIINATQWTCAATCVSYDINYTVYEIAQLGQELDAEVAMAFFQALLFILMIPFTLALYAGRDSQPAGGKQDTLDYQDYNPENPADSSTAEYSDL